MIKEMHQHTHTQFFKGCHKPHSDHRHKAWGCNTFINFLLPQSLAAIKVVLSSALIILQKKKELKTPCFLRVPEIMLFTLLGAKEIQKN
jgi:hypothetical protein